MGCRPLLVCVAGISVGALLCSCGPRMDRQWGVRPFARQLPIMAPGTVPFAPSASAGVPSPPMRNPLPATPAVVAEGALYYGYYCAMCHGDDGRGQTPVGESYDPRPTDLASPAVGALSDGDLYRRMLSGRGHAPVMTATVPPERRWQIVLHLRRLSPPRRVEGPARPD